MTKNPITIQKNILAAKSLEILNKNKITALIVASEKSTKKKIKVIGLIHIHEILKAGIK